MSHVTIAQQDKLKLRRSIVGTDVMRQVDAMFTVKDRDSIPAVEKSWIELEHNKMYGGNNQERFI